MSTFAVLSCTVTVLCLSQIYAHSHHSCGLSQGTVCIPTACSQSNCSLFTSAICVNDRCGCEARFFNYLTATKTYKDVTKMCASSNTVLGITNFTDIIPSQNDEDSNSTHQIPEKVKKFVKFFRQFNNLVTEILTDVTEYLNIVALKHPTQEHIALAKKAMTDLSTLKNFTAEHRAKIMAAKKQVHDEDGSVRDEDIPSKYMPAFKKTADVLNDLVSDEGQYSSAVKEGKTAISKKDPLAKLRDLDERVLSFLPWTNRSSTDNK